MKRVTHNMEHHENIACYVFYVMCFMLRVYSNQFYKDNQSSL